MFVYLGGTSCHFASLRFNKLLNHVCVSTGSCYPVCRSAKGERRPNRVGETLSVIGRLFNQSKQTGRSVGETHLGCAVETGDISRICSSPLLSRGLKREPSPFDAQSPHFPQDFDTKLAKKPRACKKKKKNGFGGLQAGINGWSIWKLLFNLSFRSW